ncbi:MAG TPA: hypothetical protein VJ767_01610 [Nitrososphaeraceae archaeon]|nr:hypothetical protein [Nitrososphaeraceae archaeon]
MHCIQTGFKINVLHRSKVLTKPIGQARRCKNVCRLHADKIKMNEIEKKERVWCVLS